MKNGRAASASVVIAVGLLSSRGFGQEPAAIPAFPAQANAITADVVVLDKQDRPVRGLMRGDFTLLEDGKPQAIVAFEARDVAMAAPQSEATVTEERVATNEGQVTRGGRTFAFLLDDLGTDPLSMEDVKKAIVRWMGERADPRDEVTLTTSSGRVWWSDRIGRGREDLVAVLGRVKGGRLRDDVSDWRTYQIVNFEGSRGGAEESTGTATGHAPANPQLPVGASSTAWRLAGDPLCNPQRRRRGNGGQALPRLHRTGCACASGGERALLPGPGRRARSQGHRHLLQRVSLRRESEGAVRMGASMPRNGRIPQSIFVGAGGLELGSEPEA